jgi:hypothetical protein
MQLAPGWRAGANCDQYPRGDRRLGEAGTNLEPTYDRGAGLSVRIATQERLEVSARRIPQHCSRRATIAGPSRCRRQNDHKVAPSRFDRHSVQAEAKKHSKDPCPVFFWNSSAAARVTSLCRLRTAAFGWALTTGESPMAYDKIASLTVEEMSALANRFEARAQSVLLRDQPQMQSDMRLAAKLIYELAGGAPTSQDQLGLHIGQALSK